MKRFDILRSAAARNNAEWCAAIWRSHGLQVEQACGLWYTPGQPPTLYPNAVSVAPNEDPVAQARLIADLAHGALEFSVKDSFDCLALRPERFVRLFRARWLWCEGAASSKSQPAPWRRVTQRADLERWEEAWRGVGRLPQRLFKPPLLADTACFVLGQPDGEGSFKGGAIAYAAAGVVGITNVFGDADGLIEAVRVHAKAASLCCYQHDETPAPSAAADWQEVGPLCVWSR